MARSSLRQPEAERAVFPSVRRSHGILWAVVAALTACGGEAVVRGAAPAGRLVSLSPAFTELTFAIGAGAALVGRTDWCDVPPEAAAIPSVGDGLAPNVEAVAARRPDAVLMYASAVNGAATHQFGALGIEVVTLPMDRLDDVAPAARRLGVLTGRRDAAERLAADFAAALDSARGAARPAIPLRVVLLAWDQPPIVIGAGSFQHELVTLAGAANVFADLPQPSGQVAIETIAARDPDVIVLLDAEGIPPWSARPEWRAVRAVREGRFVPVSGSVFARPSPRALEAVRNLRDALLRAAP